MVLDDSKLMDPLTSSNVTEQLLEKSDSIAIVPIRSSSEALVLEVFVVPGERDEQKAVCVWNNYP